MANDERWKFDGVRVVSGCDLDSNTPQTVPPFVPHQEINAAPDQPLECVLVRSGQDPVVVNLDIAAAETPKPVRWVDDIHRM